VGFQSLTRDGAHVPCIRRCILNPWTTREIPTILFFTNTHSNFKPQEPQKAEEIKPKVSRRKEIMRIESRKQ